MPTKKQAAAFLGYFAKMDPDNAKKMEDNEKKRAILQGAIDVAREKEKAKKMKTAAVEYTTGTMYDEQTCPFKDGRDMRAIGLAMMGIMAAVEMRCLIDEGQQQGSPDDNIIVIEPTTQAVKLSGNLAECDDALSKLLASEPVAVQSALKGMMRTVVTVENRAVAAFLYLHPSIYGRGSLKSRMDRTAAALGVGPATLPKWFSLRNLESKRYVEKWLPIAKELTWEKVRASFYSAWANQWKLEATDTVTAHLGVYEKYIAGSMMSYISRHTSGTTTAGRKSSAMNDCNTVVVKMGTKIVRLDKSKGRKHLSQEAFVIERVKERWKQGDPIGKIELKDEVMVRDDCGPGTAFYQSYIDPTKTSALSGWINWLSRVLSRGGWSLRANSIGQTVPENWRSMAEANAEKISTRLKAENVQVTINADQTFVNFFAEEEVVVAPTGTKRVGGKIKSDVKKGFTLMVGCCLETGQMEPPFAVFDGTKLCTAKFKERTLAWKHRNWRHSTPGRAGFMAFQKKHWFDQDITIQWLEWVLDVLYPGKKVGISLDMAPAQQLTGRVKEYVDKRTAEGRLVLEYIDGGLTSVLQIADLAANKDIKAIIKRLYLTYRRGFIRTERAKYPGEPDKRITMKLPIVAMMEIIEAGVVEFNMKQRESESIKKTFISAGQHPWKDCTLEFKNHLDNLSKLPLYGGCCKGVTKNDKSNAEDVISLLQRAAREPLMLPNEGFAEEEDGRV